MKKFTGERYIYFLMAYYACKNSHSVEYVRIGDDNGFVGGEKFHRVFSLKEYKGRTILTETKNSRAFASFSRYIQVIEPSTKSGLPSFFEYINESGENGFKVWSH